jgi:hypothetical protein
MLKSVLRVSLLRQAGQGASGSMMAARYLSDSEREKLRKSRPISPHLTVYKLPYAAQLHFGHRATGIGMTAGAQKESEN